MCRWLVYKGDLILLSDLLYRCQNALVHQTLHTRALTPGLEEDCARNAALNGDGFGIAWYDFAIKSSCALFKTIAPAWSDINLRELAEATRAHLVFAHVRAASSGLTVSRENCHPFKRDAFTFMHNGAIAGFKKIKRALQASLREDVYHGIHGNTDSEHAFALFLNELDETTKYYTPIELRDALCRAIRHLLAIQRAAGITEASSLNFALSDGFTVIATRFRNHVSEQPPSLYFSYGAEFTMCPDGEFRMRDHTCGKCDTLLVASEPLTHVEEDWKLVPRNHVLVSSCDPQQPNAVVAVELHPIPWEDIDATN